MNDMTSTMYNLRFGLALPLVALVIVSMAFVAFQGPVQVQNTVMILAGIGCFAFLSGVVDPRIPLICTLIFVTSPLPEILNTDWSAYVSALFIGGSFVGGLFESSFRDAFRSDPLYGKVWVFLAYGVLSVLRGLALHNPAGYVLGDFFQVAEFASVYILCRVLLKDREMLRRVLTVVFTSLVITVVFQLVLAALGGAASEWLPTWEGTGSESLARTIDINAVLLLAVLVNLFACAGSFSMRVGIWLLLAVTTANVLLSLSRGEWLGSLVAVMVSILLPTSENKKRVLGAFASVLLIFMVLGTAWKIGNSSGDNFLGIFEERVSWGVSQVEQGFEGDASLATRRFIEFVLIVPQIPEAPVLGKGAGATYEIGGFAVLNAVSADLVDHHFIHSLFLQIAFRMGFLGLFLYIWILLRFFRKGVACYRRLVQGRTKAVVGGVIAGIAGLVVISMTEPVMLRHPECALVGFAMALTFRLSLPESTGASPSGSMSQ
jgi:O-antigen ligase